MSLCLTLHTQLEVPLEADCLEPGRLAGLATADIESLPLLYGNQRVCLGDFFTVSGQAGEELRVVGDLSRVKYLGAGLKRGSIIVDGDVGAHLGAAMSGGEITVRGSAADWVAADMTGGRIVIQGDAGHMLGSAHRGSAVGIRGGEIMVHGNAGNETGNGMRRGLIAVAGDSGDFTGVNMIAGSIFVLGKLGQRPGAGMKRGSIVSFQHCEVLPTFSYAASYHPVFLRSYLLHLQRLGLPVTAEHLQGRYERWSGDSIELNRGEILLYADTA